MLMWWAMESAKKIGESIGEEECMMTKSMALLGTSLVGSMLGMTMPAHAQDAATPQMGVQDILVTARRQEESLQTTPIAVTRSEEHTSELQSLMRISYAVFCLKKKKTPQRV